MLGHKTSPSRPRRRLSAAVAMSAVLATGLGASGLLSTPAFADGGGDPFSPGSYPRTVRIDSTGDATGDSDLTLSRTANANAGGTLFNQFAFTDNMVDAVGYRAADNYLYGIDKGNQHLLRIGSDGYAVDLDAVTGLPAGEYVAGGFGADGLFYVMKFNSDQLIAIDVVDNAVVGASSRR